VSRPRWSVVVPAFNEARRLPRYLEEVIAYFDARGEPYEVLVVDDGSSDSTVAAVEALARRHAALRVLRMASNEGKGAAVRRGMLAAEGVYRLFTDADGATPIVELERLEAALMSGAEVAIGSRAVPEPGVAVVARRHRIAAGRVFSWMVGRIGVKGVVDSQCGFKAFTAKAADRLFGRLVTRGFGFDVEVLLRAQADGFEVREVPVNWCDQAESKVGVLKDGPWMVAQILRARIDMARKW
jgi:dolichyl-phosphate beta-glucosyltransferase